MGYRFTTVTAVAWVQSLAQELPHVSGSTKKKKKKERKALCKLTVVLVLCISIIKMFYCNYLQAVFTKLSYTFIALLIC